MQQTKRDELVRKALDTFYRNGFHATGMDMIASETGVSKTSIYKHFRTKEDLILAVLRCDARNAAAARDLSRCSSPMWHCAFACKSRGPARPVCS